MMIRLAAALQLLFMSAQARMIGWELEPRTTRIPPHDPGDEFAVPARADEGGDAALAEIIRSDQEPPVPDQDDDRLAGLAGLRVSVEPEGIDPARAQPGGQQPASL
jgi:hypothetical protein